VSGGGIHSRGVGEPKETVLDRASFNRLMVQPESESSAHGSALCCMQHVTCLPIRRPLHCQCNPSSSLAAIGHRSRAQLVAIVLVASSCPAELAMYVVALQQNRHAMCYEPAWSPFVAMASITYICGRAGAGLAPAGNKDMSMHAAGWDNIKLTGRRRWHNVLQPAQHNT
jgi:hypothetical protein